MINLVQHKGGNGTTPTTATLTKSPMVGSLLVLCIGLVDTGTTITVPAGFTAVGTAATSGTTSTGQIYYKIAAAGESNSFAISKTGTANDMRWVMLEYQGIDQTTPLDKTATATSAGAAVTTLLSGSITPAVTNFVVVAFYALSTIANTVTSWTNGFVTEDTGNSNRGVGGDLTVTGSAGTGAYSTTLLWTASGVSCGVIANFKSDGLGHLGTGLNNFQQPTTGDGMSSTEKIR